MTAASPDPTPAFLKADGITEQEPASEGRAALRFHCVDRSQPREGPGRRCPSVKPEGHQAESCSDRRRAANGPHPAEAVPLWEQVLSRGNLAQARERRADRRRAGSDGKRPRRCGPAPGEWPEVRSQLEAGIYRPLPARRVLTPNPGRAAHAGGAGCGGSDDLPGHRAGAHAYLQPAFSSP